MKQHIILITFSFLTVLVKAQYNDPNFPKPTSGYGTEGTHSVGVITFPNPNYATKDVEIYYPKDISGKVPTIFYSHAFGGNNSATIQGMLTFVAKKGYAIVYVPYQTVGVTIDERYTNLLNGFRMAARNYPNIIDTTKVGFMGHSFGGGASFGNAFTCFTENNWGSNGRFIYALAQWYSFHISQNQLQNFPANTQLLTEIFDEDDTNDHRMAIDIFKNISIPNSEKDFVLLKSDTIGNYIYLADHVVPNNVTFDALDYYAYYRFIDALCDYSFNGNLNGKKTALGNGSIEQVTMPSGLKKLIENDAPIATHTQSIYQFPCNDQQNLRSNYCTYGLSISKTNSEQTLLSIYPNPATNELTIHLPAQANESHINIYNSLGLLIKSMPTADRNTVRIDVSTWAKGLYYINCNGSKQCIIVE